ncbi:hypothetical protein [Massilia sp. Root351]|uniref:AbiJ-related protein n=1 Tax=Massilia sp. Root351 TaxID=1736522 RepID=UPI0035A290A4
MFDKLGAFDAPNRRFAYLLEGLASGNVRPDEPAQRHFVDLVNKMLRSHAIELAKRGIRTAIRSSVLSRWAIELFVCALN